MKVVFLVTSSGGSFYCSNCYRDMLYFTAVRINEGVESSAIPLYLPPEKIYVESGFDQNVFFGAISLYIRERVHFLSKMPAFLDRILDSGPLLRLAAQRAGTTRSEGLEDLTLNMISSHVSTRENEIKRLVRYMNRNGKPDVIHLSNALVIGLAGQIKKELDVKIVCSLQNEDDWLNEMAEPYQSKAWKMIEEEAEHVDGFVCPSRYFRDFFLSRAAIPAEKIHIIPSGIETWDHVPSQAKDRAQAIGFFSRVSYHNGFDKLVDAFLLLKKENGFKDLELHVCGGYTADDKPFIAEQIKKVKDSGYREYIRIFPGFQGRGKIDFLDSIDIMSVPVRKYDGYGLYILEANVASVPVVQPATGAFPEILDATGGGVIYNPDTVEALAENLRSLLLDPSKARELGETGRKNVLGKLTHKHMGEALGKIYSELQG